MSIFQKEIQNKQQVQQRTCDSHVNLTAGIKFKSKPNSAYKDLMYFTTSLSEKEFITEEDIIKDFKKGFALKVAGCYHKFYILDKNNFIIMTVNCSSPKGKKDALNKLSDLINGRKYVCINKAKYVSETYCNGKLENTFESDWDGDYFEPERSTYKSNGDIWITKTYYKPPYYDYVETYPGSFSDSPDERVKKFVDMMYILK